MSQGVSSHLQTMPKLMLMGLFMVAAAEDVQDDAALLQRGTTKYSIGKSFVSEASQITASESAVGCCWNDDCKGPDTWCGANSSRCEGCGGEWRTATGQPPAGEGQCCWNDDCSDRSGCTVPTDWCAREDRCKSSCSGTWCTADGPTSVPTPLPTPLPTTMPTPEPTPKDGSSGKCCWNPDCSGCTDETNWCNFEDRCAGCGGIWCPDGGSPRRRAPPRRRTPSPTSPPTRRRTPSPTDPRRRRTPSPTPLPPVNDGECCWNDDCSGDSGCAGPTEWCGVSKERCDGCNGRWCSGSSDDNDADAEAFDAEAGFPANAMLVQNQGSCGSCAAFSSTESLAARIIYNKEQIDEGLLSAQVPLIWAQVGACNGAWPLDYGNWFNGNGIPDYMCGPYLDATARCRMFSDGAETGCIDPSSYTFGNCFSMSTQEHNWVDYGKHRVSSYVVKGEAVFKQELLENGPFAVNYAVYPNFYSSSAWPHGIYSVPPNPENKYGGHSVMLTAWGIGTGIKYWRMRNSWGSSWGENGYFRMLRGENFCLIESGYQAAAYKLTSSALAQVSANASDQMTHRRGNVDEDPLPPPGQWVSQPLDAAIVQEAYTQWQEMRPLDGNLELEHASTQVVAGVKVKLQFRRAVEDPRHRMASSVSEGESDDVSPDVVQTVTLLKELPTYVRASPFSTDDGAPGDQAHAVFVWALVDFSSETMSP